jgi:hypothetical protein
MRVADAACDFGRLRNRKSMPGRGQLVAIDDATDVQVLVGVLEKIVLGAHEGGTGKGRPFDRW